MKYKIGDFISFDGSIDTTKDVYYYGLRNEHEINPDRPNEKYITRVLITHPHSMFRVVSLLPPYYVCEKIFEKGDEEIPLLAGGIFIHNNEAIHYDYSFNGKVINKKRKYEKIN